MTFVSTLLGRTVTDVEGERIGTLKDLVAVARGDMPHPQIVALEVKRPGGLYFIPYSDVAVLLAPAVALTRHLVDVAPYKTQESDLYLARDVLDKQIIDTDGMRVVRVNDVQLARVNNNYYVANVDIGGLGLLRRLGMDKMARALAKRLGRDVPPGVISWDGVELLPGDHAIRLKVTGDKLADLHPADLAEIISDLSRSESSKFLESLDVETVADALEEVEPDFQASLVEDMSDEKVADVLEEMAPDEAADLLAELSDERSADLLNLMEKDEAADVRKLLAYPEDSAGGIMTTEFITIHPDLSAEQAIAHLREMAEEAETLYYIYVVDADEHLLGVLSLRDLVLAKPATPVTAIMQEHVMSVPLLESQDEVAQVVAKYNLLAVPVVDEQGCLHGIVTVDDALDKIIPTAWKKRLPRLYR
jgi:magnesium transporter